MTHASVMVMENDTTDTAPCPDPNHDHKMRAWANKCPTCFGRGTVPTRTQRFAVASGPEREVFRHEDLTGRQA